MRRMRIIARALVAALLFVVLAPASTADESGEDPEFEGVGTPIVAGPGSAFAGYYVSEAVVPVGGALFHVNADPIAHDVVSVETGPDDQPWCTQFQEGECPLLWSPLIGVGVAPVHGTENLEPGETYEFYCTPHQNTMRGKLTAL